MEAVRPVLHPPLARLLILPTQVFLNAIAYYQPLKRDLVVRQLLNTSMRYFLRRPFQVLLAGAIALVLISCQITSQAQNSSPTDTPNPEPIESPASLTPTEASELSAAPAELPPLPYDYAALEPYIDAETMRLHHDNHHATYVKNLNEVVQSNPDLQNLSVEAMLRDLDSLPEAIRIPVRNNGGGHVNHTMFWQIMAPDAGGEPTGALADAINQTFGSFDEFKRQFNEAGANQFGSGWVWLVRSPEGQLQITSTLNQDNPIMQGLYPVMGNDVWEHAYYLNYQNRRAEYLENWWNVVNWAEVDRRFTQASRS
jgi:superoxide dismutase, Fe-Mn family